MDREVEVITENPWKNYKAILLLILDLRQRKLPTIPLTCGNQPANIRVVYRRITCGSLSFLLPGYREVKQEKYFTVDKGHIISVFYIRALKAVLI